MKSKISSRWFKLIRFKRRQARRVRFLTRHPSFRVPLLTLLILILISIGLYVVLTRTKQITPVPNAKIVIISHDGVSQIVPTNLPTIRALLTRLKIKLNPGDVVEPELNTPINQDDFRINIYRAKPVAIVKGPNIKYVMSAAQTPRAVVQQSNIKIYPEDYVTAHPVANFVRQGIVGEVVNIDPATPVNLNLYGKNFLIRTHAKTVGALIAAEHIRLRKTDQLVPVASSKLSPNSVVFIIQKGINVSTSTQVIPMPIQTIYDSSLAYGTSAVRQQGSAGQEVITYQNQTQNGQVISSSPLQTIVTVQPVTEIVVEGTSLSGIKGDMAFAGISSNDYQYADYIISHESGWCPTKAQGEYYCPAIPNDPYTPNGYGLCQATPGYKMETAGSDWETNPITQLKWCNQYAQSRYGGWYNAYIHWINNGNW